MWTAAYFYAERLLARLAHNINFYFGSVLITESTFSAHLESFFSRMFLPVDFQVFFDLSINNFFYLIKLFPCNFFRMRKIKPGPFGADIRTTLDDMISQNLPKCFVHKMRGRMKFFGFFGVIYQSALKDTLCCRLTPLSLFSHTFFELHTCIICNENISLECFFF